MLFLLLAMGASSVLAIVLKYLNTSYAYGVYFINYVTCAVLACCGQGAAPAVPPPPVEPAMVEQILQEVLRQWKEFGRVSKAAICATRPILRKFCGQTRRGTRREDKNIKKPRCIPRSVLLY